MKDIKRIPVVPLSYANKNLALDNEIMIDYENGDILIKSGENAVSMSEKIKEKIPTYTHPSYTNRDAGLYKFSVDSTGHVASAESITKEDITALGIPGSDTVYTHPNSGVTAGTYRSVTVDNMGHVTAGSNPTTPITQGGTGATTAENALKNLGLTASAAEINLTSGATSNIQTQLDSKAPLNSPIFTGTPAAPTASAGTSSTQIATTAFVQTAIGNAIAASDAMVIKGTIGTSGTITVLPTTYKTGWTYRVVTNGTYAGEECEIGDLIIALVDRDGADNADSDWCVAQTNINGAITGVKGGDAYIEYSQSGSVVTITHKDVVRTNSASTASLSHGGTFTAVKSVASDAKGHVTGVDTETITLPTQYTHPSYTAYSSGLYKISVDAMGHVSAATAVSKADITALGIPGSDTTYGTGTASALGLTKLYTSTGSNTDGTMTQKAISDELENYKKKCIYNVKTFYFITKFAEITISSDLHQALLNNVLYDSFIIWIKYSNGYCINTLEIDLSKLNGYYNPSDVEFSSINIYLLNPSNPSGNADEYYSISGRTISLYTYTNGASTSIIDVYSTPGVADYIDQIITWRSEEITQESYSSLDLKNPINKFHYAGISVSKSTSVTDTSVALAATHANPNVSGSLAAQIANKANSSHAHSIYMTKSNPVSSGTFSHGRKSGTTTGSCSVAIGYSTVASGSYSHAEGYGANATGDISHAEGWGTTASGSYSHAEGQFTTASGSNSHAEGYYTTALTGQHAQGHHNDTSLATAIDSNSGISAGTAFVIGNGTSSAKSNAFRITGEGVTYAKSAYNSTGADYAEFAEWADGNPDSEDRRGYFVTFDEEKPNMIRKANEGEYILGIISGNPCIIGNSDEAWLGQYCFDEFGAIIYEDREEEETYIDEETGEEKIRIITAQFYKLNPDYDPEREYIHRKDRKEWDYVGWIGVLSVRDDGTCIPGGYCRPTNGGIATSCERGIDTYRVLERAADNVVKVALK